MTKKNRPYLWQVIASVLVAVGVSYPLQVDGYYLFAIFMLTYIAIGASMILHRIYTLDKQLSEIKREVAKVEVILQAKNINDQLRIEKEKQEKNKN